MGLIRSALIALAIAIGLMLIKRLLGSRASALPPKPTTPKLVMCAHCGLHVAESEALRTGDRYYCSAEHQRQGGPG